MALIIMISVSCNDLLDEPLQNEQLQEQVDYTQSENMILLLHGAYGEWDNLQWETFPIISVRGDDVNAAGDQFPLQETDFFRYERNFWMYNSTWLNLYNDVLLFNAAIDNIRLYMENGASEADGQQYIAEIKVLRAFELLQLARLWGDIIIPETAEPADLLDLPVSDFDAVMQHIVSEMDEAIPNLPSIRPNQRT
ncbi:MAG: RagB/SusD family nutrient uptake outer membrane protein, partial [Bacteroidales bacterium]